MVTKTILIHKQQITTVECLFAEIVIIPQYNLVHFFVKQMCDHFPLK